MIKTDFDLKAFIADQKAFGATALVKIAEVLKSTPLSPPDLQELHSAYLQGVGAYLKSGFPRDALRNLEALRRVAEKEQLKPCKSSEELTQEWDGIKSQFGFPDGNRITAYGARDVFRQKRIENPDAERSRLLDHLDETISHVTENPDFLRHAVEPLKVYGYLGTAGSLQPNCMAFLENLATIAFDPAIKSFRQITPEDAIQQGEKIEYDPHFPQNQSGFVYGVPYYF
jgi:hypothetical protein